MICKEVAVFKFKEDCIEGAIELNKALISEMQKESNNTLISFEVLQSLKDPCIFTWLIDFGLMLNRQKKQQISGFHFQVTRSSPQV